MGESMRWGRTRWNYSDLVGFLVVGEAYKLSRPQVKPIWKAQAHSLPFLNILGQQMANICWHYENRAPTCPMGGPLGGHVKIYLPTGVVGRTVLTTRAFGLGWAARKNVNRAFGRAGLPISYWASPMEQTHCLQLLLLLVLLLLIDCVTEWNTARKEWE